MYIYILYIYILVYIYYIYTIYIYIYIHIYIYIYLYGERGFGRRANFKFTDTTQGQPVITLSRFTPPPHVCDLSTVVNCEKTLY